MNKRTACRRAVTPEWRSYSVPTASKYMQIAEVFFFLTIKYTKKIQKQEQYKNTCTETNQV